MLWDLEQYHMGGYLKKRMQAMDWREDIKEMKRDWGMDGASNLAMAGAAMIAAVSALSFWVSILSQEQLKQQMINLFLTIKFLPLNASQRHTLFQLKAIFKLFILNN